jgi:hemolysin D
MMSEQLNPRRELLRKYKAVFSEAWKSRNDNRDRPVYKVTEADFLPAALAISERPTPVAPQLALWGLVALVLFVFLWSAIGRLDVVVVAPGRVLASGRTHPVQPLETQIVRRVLVVEGQKVAADDVLIEVDPTSAEAEMQRFSDEMRHARRMIATYAALFDRFAEAKAGAKIPAEADEATSADLAADIVRSRWRDYQTRVARSLTEIERRRAEENVAVTALENAKSKLALRRRFADDYQKMMQEGAVARHAWMERQINLDDLEREILQARAQIQQAQVAVRLGVAEREVIDSEVVTLWSDRLVEARRELSAAQSEHEKAQYRHKTTVLRAPVDGVVQQLGALAAGHVITSGQSIATIVPTSPIQEVEVQIENRDIGLLKVGQEAAIKISAYDYTRYGTVPATITFITPDAIADDKGNLRYLVRLQLTKNAFLIDGISRQIAPGMEVSADVKIGRRRIVSYFLSPIIRSVSEAIREH